MPFILPANTLSAGGYDVANSLRVNENDSPRLHKTNGTPTSRRKFTFSCWVKRASLDAASDLHMLFNFNGNSNRFYVAFFGDQLRVNATKSGDGTTAMDIKTNRLFRDFSAWYSIVVAVDTEQGTAANRVKIFINGVQETSFATETYPSEDDDIHVNESDVELLEFKNNAAHFFDGYITEIVYIDGSQEAVTSFGEFDEDSGIFKPIDVSGLNFGNNGFYLDFEDSSNLGNDANGGTDFTEVNIVAVDQSTDTCTNNSATFNPLFTPNPSNVSTFSEGNLKVVTNSTSQNSEGLSTLGLTTGKWYGEFKLIAQAAGESLCGVLNNIENVTSSGLNGTGGFSVASNGDSFNNGSSQGAGNFSASYTTNDIIGIALDLDNNRVYFSKNGSYTDGSGNFDESSPTGYFSLTSGQTYFMGVGDKSTSQSSTWEANFGSPSFAISSSNTDANDYGNFEYAVPSGYYSLNTKNLAEFG